MDKAVEMFKTKKVERLINTFSDISVVYKSQNTVK